MLSAAMSFSSTATTSIACMHARPKRKTGRRCSTGAPACKMQAAAPHMPHHRKSPLPRLEHTSSPFLRTYLLCFDRSAIPYASLCTGETMHACHYTKPSREPHTPPMPPLCPLVPAAARRHARTDAHRRHVQPLAVTRVAYAVRVTFAGAPTGHVRPRPPCPPARRLRDHRRWGADRARDGYVMENELDRAASVARPPGTSATKRRGPERGAPRPAAPRRRAPRPTSPPRRAGRPRPTPRHPRRRRHSPT